MTIRRSRTEAPTIGPFVEGLVGAVALAGLTTASTSVSTGVVVVGVGMGTAAVAFALGGGFLRPVAEALYAGLTLIAIVPAASDFLKGGVCGHGVATPLRWAALLLLIAVAGLAAAASVLTLRRFPRPGGVGLALFGSLQILLAATTFIIGTGTSQEMGALAVMVLGACMLGWLAVKATDAVLAVAGVAFGMQSLYAAAADAGCGGGYAGGLLLILFYCASYFVGRAVTRPFSGRR